MPRKFKPRPLLIGEGHTDEELLNKFITLCNSHLSPNSVKTYQKNLGYFYDYLKEKKLTLRKLKSEHVDAFLAQWQGRTAARIYGLIIQRFLNFLGLVDPKKGLQVDVPKVPNNKLEHIRRQIITKEDFENYLQACGSNHVHALLGAILWETGIRVSELIPLQWQHVNFEEGLLELPQRKGGAIDSVPFGLYTFTYLRLLSTSGHKPTDPLVPSQSFRKRGTPISVDGVRSIIRKIGFSINWRPEQCHPHAFRHSFATYLVRQGVPLPAVKELMNHKDIKTTDVYTHLAKSDIIDSHRQVMRPDWKPPSPEKPAEPPKCPECDLVRLPGYRVCPACGFNYAARPTVEEGSLLAELFKDREVRQVLETKLKELLAEKKT